VIADFAFIDDSEYYHNRYVLYDKKHDSQFTDLLELVILELPKLPQKSDQSAAWMWTKFFNTKSDEEMQMLAKENEKIGKAVMVLEKLSADDQARAQAEKEEMLRRDEESRMRGAEKRGEQRKAEKAARSMKADGVDTAFITKHTGLNAIEIAKL
jgi:predicted transposase/invertase (TIGR01784 family)